VVDLDPGADALAFAGSERAAGIAPCKPIDVGEVVIVAQLDYSAPDTDMGVPTGFVQHSDRHSWVISQVVQSSTAFVHAHEEAIAVEEVPRWD